MHKPDNSPRLQATLMKPALSRQGILIQINHTTKDIVVSNSILLNSVLSSINSVLSSEEAQASRRPVGSEVVTLPNSHYRGEKHWAKFEPKR